MYPVTEPENILSKLQSGDPTLWVIIVAGILAVLAIALALKIFGIWPSSSSQVADHATQRRTVVSSMFVILSIGVVLLTIALITAAKLLGNGTTKIDGQTQGIVMTAIAGAISSVLSFMGIIVKGFVDKLRESDNPNDDENGKG